MKRLFAVALTLFAFLTALAAGETPIAKPPTYTLPAPKHKEIIVPTSIAGLKPGMTLKAAWTEWGKRGYCTGFDPFDKCSYGTQSSGKGSVEMYAGANGKIGGFSLYAGDSGDVPGFPYTGPTAGGLVRIKTPEGIGLGSPLSRVISAYPKGEVATRSKTTPFISYVIAGKVTEMRFIASAQTKKIGQININPKSER